MILSVNTKDGTNEIDTSKMMLDDLPEFLESVS